MCPFIRIRSNNRRQHITEATRNCFMGLGEKAKMREEERRGEMILKCSWA
jgi:hypothetical protein